MAYSLEEWPDIRHFELSVGIQFDSDRVDIEVPIYGPDGRIQYRLVCRGGNYDAYIAKLEDDEAGDYMWPFSCTLGIGSEGRFKYLLMEHLDGKPYKSRAHFSHASLLGACGDYPEYGRQRSFRLRGMELRLSVTEIVEREPDPESEFQEFIEYLVMEISARRDQTAKTAHAERTGYLRPTRPGASCDTIEEGYEPLMCRDSDYRLINCPENSEFEIFEPERAYLREQGLR